MVERAIGEHMATRPDHYIYARGPHTLEISMALSALIQAGKGKGRKGSGHALRRIGHASLRMKGVARQSCFSMKFVHPERLRRPDGSYRSAVSVLKKIPTHHEAFISWWTQSGRDRFGRIGNSLLSDRCGTYRIQRPK